MMLLCGSNIDDEQRIPILSSASSGSLISSTDTVASIVTTITYEKVGFIIRQCDSKLGHLSNSETIHANLVNNPSRRQGRSNRSGPINSNFNCHNNKNRHGQLSPDAFRTFKFETRCKDCRNHGHWEVHYGNNGIIRDGLPFIPPAEKESNNHINNKHGTNNGAS